MDLKALGINEEELIERIADNATDRIVSLYRDRVEDGVHAEAQRRILEGVAAKLNDTINELATSALSAQFQPVDRWGEPQGKPTTIRDMFYEAARDWWSQDVGSDGKPISGYNSSKTSRAKYIAAEVLKPYIQSEFKSAIEQVAVDAKAALGAVLQAELGNIIKKTMR